MTAHPHTLVASSFGREVPCLQQAVTERLQKVILRLTLVLSDASMLASAFLLAYWIRFDLQVSISPEVVPSPEFYALLALVLMPVWIGLFAVYGLYSWENLLGGTTEYSRVFNACAAGMMLVVVAAFVKTSFVVARGWLVAAWILSVLLVCVSRFCIRRIAYALRDRGLFLVPALVVGWNGEALSLAEQLTDRRSSGYYIVGLVSSRSAEAADLELSNRTGLPLLGSIDEVEAIVDRSGVKELIVAASSLERGELADLFERVQQMKGVIMRLSTGLYEVLTTGVQVKTAASVPFISLNKLRLDPLEMVIKTAVEYLVASAALLLLSPVLLLISLLIKAESPGPVIHRRRVLGVEGKEFDAYKFRTMYVNGDELLEREPTLRTKLDSDGKLREDPRVTQVGKWLRRYSLDELPQLVNVLRGQMSLVGPRMITPNEAAKYGRHKVNLLTVKPGITGLWQVSGRSDLSYDERVRLDMHYIRNYSIWLDLQILFVQTPTAVFGGKGAY
jgi:exopolysaccharide biosynthesis polyprenyl glycosylphosphotransferase